VTATFGEGGAIEPAGTLAFLRRTLGRTMRAMSREPGAETGPAAAQQREWLSDLAVLLGLPAMPTLHAPQGASAMPTAAGGDQPGPVQGRPEPAEVVALPRLDTHEAVRAERVEALPPGLPEEPVTLSLSAEMAPGPVVGPGGAPPLTGLIQSGASPVGPSFAGSWPLVAPALSAVAAQAMLSSRREAPARASQPAAGPAESSAPSGGAQAIDLDALAMEMAERILRRMKREKERRGYHD